MRIQDEASRLQALNPEQSFIVEAPAGSGKTELLVQRILSLLATSVRFPEEMVAITFTRKAAHEMRSRIILALEKAKQNNTSTMQSATVALAQQVLARDAKENWNLLGNPNRLSIQTIDAFCMRLTAQMPVLSGVGGNTRMANHPDELYEKSVKALLATLDQETPWQAALITIFNHFDNQYPVIEAIFIDMLKKRDQWLPYITGIKDQQLLKQQFEQHLKNINEDLIKKVNAEFTQDLIKILIPIAHYASVNILNDSPIKACEDLSTRSLPQWLGIAELLLTKEGGYRKQVDKRTGFPANVKNDYKIQMLALLESLQDNENLRQALVLLREAPPLTFTENSWDFLQALLVVLPLMAAQLILTFEQYQQLDFIEVATRALQALGDDEMPTDLALVLDYRLQHILIDEFQDTSLTQFNLLEKLTTSWQEGDGRTLFLVGDPQQSIYRFRQANVGLFLKAKNQGIGAIKLTPLQLSMNFRSLPVLIDWINQTMPSIMPNTPNIALGAVSFNASQAARAHDASGAIHCLCVEDVMQEAQAVISGLQNIRKQHPDWKIAILVRARPHLAEILSKLKAEQIPYQALEIEPIINSSVVNDLLALTRALLHVYDRVAWLALLRTPLCGIELAEIETLAMFDESRALWDLMQDPQVLLLLSKDTQLRLKRLCEALIPTIHNRDRMPLAQWVEGAWLATGGVHAAAFDEAANCAAFFKLLTQLAQDYAHLDAQQLTEQLAQLYCDQITTENNPVQVMTIHKSKGLEFDAVFLPGLAKRPALNTPPLLRYVEQTLENSHYWLLAPIHAKTAEQDPIYYYLGRIEKHQEDLETGRLLYVALTRAKQQLYLFAVQNEERNPTPGSLFALLSKKIQFTSAPHLVPLPLRSGTTTMGDPVWEGTEVRGKTYLNRIPLDWQLPQPWFSWLHEPQESPTENNVDPTEFEPENIMRKQVGVLLHRILKSLAEKGIGECNLLNLNSRWKIQLQELGVISQQLNTALELLTQAVTNTINDSRGQWILHNHSESACEYPLHTHYKNKYTRIIIDRTFVFENERWIIDYKSGHQETEHYTKQLQHYARIMQQIDKRPIRLALYFPLTTQWEELPCAN